MAFSKAVLLVVFAVLLISAEVSSHRDLVETTTTPTTDHDDRGGFNKGAIGGNTGHGGSVACNRGSKVPCKNKGRNEVPKCNDPTKRECHRNGKGGKGGKGGNGGNGGKGGRGGHGHETEN